MLSCWSLSKVQNVLHVPKKEVQNPPPLLSILGSRRVYVGVIRNDVNLDGMVAQRAKDKDNKIMVS